MYIYDKIDLRWIKRMGIASLNYRINDWANG